MNCDGLWTDEEVKEKLQKQMRKVKDAIFLCTIGASNNIDRKRLLNELSKF